ncbi:MAG TPA: DUF3108 domain-containing protein [Dehalococcoidia bacterium]|jgi:hypothetical protein|nr:DUF3108 domain-containing protein [Dehalococcoidia bacterium]
MIVLFVACGGGDDELVARDIVSSIPWDISENARYRLLQGDDVKGSGEFELFQDADGTRITQSYAIPDEEITDVIDAEVSVETLRPRLIERVIDGPEGKRECRAEYSSLGNAVSVNQRAGEDERTDELGVPSEHYDSWSDLFLWRTIEFFEGQELKYVDVLSCSLAKPDLLSVVLKVKAVEEVTVPAGKFQAWRLEIRSGGRTQKAWYADDERRTLVRYDNGDLVFELESIN